MANTYKNAFADLTTTNVTTVYTTPGATTSIIQAINLANVSASEVTVTVLVHDDSSSTDFTLINEVTVPGDSTLQVVDRPIVLETADLLKIQASVADRIEVIVSILQVTA
jgi:hypothetical protein